MKLTFTTYGRHSTLKIETCFLDFFKHVRVVNAALNAAPDAIVTTSGLIVIRTLITGDAPSMWVARMAARKEQE